MREHPDDIELRFASTDSRRLRVLL